MKSGPQHKSRAITYIRPEQRRAAEKEQTLVIQGKGKLLRRKPHLAPVFAIEGCVEGSFDKEQAKKNKLLGYW